MPTVIAQITDLHICETGSAMEKNINTAAFLKRAVTHLNNLVPRPDLLMITGDLVDQRNATEYDRLRGLLADLTMPFYLLVGNHDDRDNLRAAFPDHAYLTEGPDGFVQYVVEIDGLRLIALDTLRAGAPEGEMCAVRLDWLDQELSASAPDRCLIFMHHPPFRTGLEMMDGMGFQNSKEFHDVLAGHGPVLRVQCGHLHRPIAKLSAGTIMATAPSCAHQIALDICQGDKIGITLEPPSVLLHVWLGPQDGLVSHTSVIGDFKQTNLTKFFRKDHG